MFRADTHNGSQNEKTKAFSASLLVRFSRIDEV